MYKVIRISGKVGEQICSDGKPSKYGTAKLFKNKKAAQEWIAKNSYKGMSFKYEVKEI